jgi:uncharacterized membrane protein required for colicin V production
LLFDILFVIYVGVQMFLGLRFGLFRRLVAFAAFYVGMLLARSLSGAASQQFGYSSGQHPSDAHFAIFLIILFFLVIAIEVVTAAFGSALTAFNALVFDRAFGTAAGAVAGVLELAVLLYLFGFLISTPIPAGTGHSPLVNSSQEQIGSSLLVKPLKSVQPAATFIFSPVLPSEPGKYFASTYA